MGLLDFLPRKRAVADMPELADFMDKRAAFITQKCVIEYARARSGTLSSKLFKEPAFRAALEETRWRNYPLALQSIAVMVEHALRREAGEAAGAMREGLIAAVGDVCGRYPVPEGFEADFWRVAQERIARRVWQAGLAGPHAIKDIPKETAREFFERLPIHPDLRSYDFELVTNNLRVNLCRAHEEFLGAADLSSLSRALVGRSQAAGGE